MALPPQTLNDLDALLAVGDSAAAVGDLVDAVERAEAEEQAAIEDLLMDAGYWLGGPISPDALGEFLDY